MGIGSCVGIYLSMHVCWCMCILVYTYIYVYVGVHVCVGVLGSMFSVYLYLFVWLRVAVFRNRMV